MDVMVSRCAGIDIGKAEVVACLRIPGSHGQRVSQVRTFSAGDRTDEPAGRLASRTPGESCGNGGDRPVLETGLGCAGRAWL